MMIEQLINRVNNSQHRESQSEQKPYKLTIIHPSAGVNWSGGSEIFAIEMANRLSNYFDVELLSGAECSEFSFKTVGLPRSYTYDLINQPLIKNLLHRFANHPEIVI